MKARALISVLAALLVCGLPVAGASAAGRPHQDGKVLYRGKTSQGRQIEIGAAPGRVTLLRFAVRALCRDGSVLHATVDGFEATTVRPGGRFADVQHGSSDAVSWKGKVAPGKISGTLRVKARLGSGVGCDSQSVRFKARRVRSKSGGRARASDDRADERPAVAKLLRSFHEEGPVVRVGRRSQ